MKIARLTLLALVAVGYAQFAVGEGEGASLVVAEFTNPALIPSHWTLTLYRNGRGSFHSERGSTKANDSAELDAPNVDRDFEVTPEFAEQVFKTAWGHKWFNEECESHMKVAFQGWKKISYTGPDGKGSCTFNYSKDKEIQTLGDALTGLAATLIEGGRLESLLQHDRLGLDREMEFIADAVKDGRMRQLGAIREILERLEEDPAVLDRVRKRARGMLGQAGR
jgi:hypothetical protein